MTKLSRTESRHAGGSLLVWDLEIGGSEYVESCKQRFLKYYLSIGLNPIDIPVYRNQKLNSQKTSALIEERLVSQDNELHWAWFRIGYNLQAAIYRASEKLSIDKRVASFRNALGDAGIGFNERDQLENLLYEFEKYYSPGIHVNSWILRRTANLNANKSPKTKMNELLDFIAVSQEIKENEERKVENHVTFNAPVTGVVNLGTVTGNIYNNITALAQDSDTNKLSEALKGLTDAIESNSELPVKQKIEALQTVESIAEQARLPTADRKPGIFRAALGYLPTILSSITSGIKIWDSFGPTIKEFFQ